MILKTIIIEDEPLAQQKLKKLLALFPKKIEIIGKAKNGPEAVEIINKLKPDLIFLDIQIPGFNGFKVIEKLDNIPLIIFTTAYDEYALKAFETNSIDYLLKPITSARLKKSLLKIENIRNKPKNKEGFKNLLNSEDKTLKKILIEIGRKLFFIPTEEIYYFSANEKYTELHTIDNYYLINTSLKELNQKLGNDFYKIHRSYIVNTEYVKEIKKESYRKFKVVLKNEKNLPISRTKKKKFLEFLKEKRSPK